jgi:hypothetical protein
MFGVSFLLGNLLLIGFPVARGLVITDGEDGTTKARRKGWELLPIWINEGVGVSSPVRVDGPGTLFLDCRE